MSEPRILKRGDDSRRNWVEINRLTEQLRASQTSMRKAEAAIKELQRESDLWATGSGGQAQRFSIISEQPDYLVCQKQNADGTLAAVIINVAKPRTLRVTTWNAQTLGDWRYTGTISTRDASYAGVGIIGGLQPGDKLAEILDPPYTGGELIAMQVTGETGVTVAGARLTWIDLNADARRFVAKRDRVDVCKLVNGVPTGRKLVIEGGPSF